MNLFKEKKEEPIVAETEDVNIKGKQEFQKPDDPLYDALLGMSEMAYRRELIGLCLEINQRLMSLEKKVDEASK